MHCTVPYVLKGIAAPIALLLIVSCQSKRETASLVKIFDGQPASSEALAGVVGIAVKLPGAKDYVPDCTGVQLHPKLVITAAHRLETWGEIAPTMEEFRSTVHVYIGAGEIFRKTKLTKILAGTIEVGGVR